MLTPMESGFSAMLLDVLLVFESYDRWSKFDPVLHTENDDVSYGFFCRGLSRSPRLR